MICGCRWVMLVSIVVHMCDSHTLWLLGEYRRHVLYMYYMRCVMKLYTQLLGIQFCIYLGKFLQFPNMIARNLRHVTSNLVTAQVKRALLKTTILSKLKSCCETSYAALFKVKSLNVWSTKVDVHQTLILPEKGNPPLLTLPVSSDP